MRQVFSTRNISIRDFEEWHEKGELVLQPKFQRREVWVPKARSYLIDTILRGKPIPKIYLRQEINPRTRRTRREIVDGQQRLRSVLDFLMDAFPVLRTHNEEHGGKRFSELAEDAQLDILKYEFVVDLLQDIPDAEVYDIFARLNTYSVTLNAQELRHAKYFGEFRVAVYALAQEFMTFWQANRIFSDRQILRMAEAEFVSELLIAMSVGIRARSKGFIDRFYEEYDDRFPRRTTLEKRFRTIMDAIGGIMADTLPDSKLREPRLLYPLFCAVYHMVFGLPHFACARTALKPSNYARVRLALAEIDEVFAKLEREANWQKRIEAGEPEEELMEEERQRRIDAGELEEHVNEELVAEVERRRAREFDPLTHEERRFYGAYSVHWVHADSRELRTEYVCRFMVDALRQ